MTSLINLTKSNLTKSIIARRDDVCVSRNLWQVGASVGLFSGTAVLFGTLFTFVTEYFYGEESHGVWMIFAAFVLLIFGAHCLDKIEEIKKYRRMEFCRRHGISTEQNSKEVIARIKIKNF